MRKIYLNARPRLDGGLPTEQAIERRRSTRDYSGAPMSLYELSRVLYMMGGINGERWGNRLRTAPSSGALYPIEAYPVVHNVDGLSPGVYHYGRDHIHIQRAGAVRPDRRTTMCGAQPYGGFATTPAT